MSEQDANKPPNPRRRPRRKPNNANKGSNGPSQETGSKPEQPSKQQPANNSAEKSTENSAEKSAGKSAESSSGNGNETTGDEKKNPKKNNNRPRQRHARKVTQRRKEIDETGKKYKMFAIDPEIYRVLFPPSDPDFPYPIPVVDLDLHLSRHYPNQGLPPYVSINNDDIPRGNAVNIEKAFQTYEGTLVEKLTKLDSNLEALLTMPAARTFTIVRGKKPPGTIQEEEEAQKAAQSETTKQDSHTEEHTEESKEEAKQNNSDSSDSSDNESDYNPDYMHSSDDEDIDTGVTGGSTDTSKPKREGTEIVFHDIKLTNAALCEIVSLNILFQCGRCKTLHTFNNLQSAEYGKPSKPRAEICSKCDLPLMVAFRKEYLHSMCHTAGYIDVDGGKVADLLPSSYSVMCGQCQETSPVFKNVDMGAQRMMNCRHCHAKLWIQLELFEFVLLSTETLAPAAKKVERAKLPAQAPKQKLHLTGGEPLPNLGACEHYRKSVRWFRFSCCQRVFPCDKCHDVEMSHPCDPASRMLCGFCSREQRFSTKCVYCEHDYTQRVSRFWEGGKGVRDRKLMSRKDKRKYKRDPVEKKKSDTHFKGKSKEAPWG